MREIAWVVARPSVNGNEDQRALVTILHTFHSTLIDHTDGEDLALIFACFECLTKRALTGMGVRHGISVSGDRERLCDAVMFHLTNRDCALSANDHWEGCIAVMQRYSHGGDTGDSLKLQTLIFTNILPRIPLRPLQRLLRLHSVTFDPDASLNRHRRVFKTS